MLEEGLADAAASAKVPLAINRVGSMICPFFVGKKGQTVRSYADATACDTQKFAKFFHSMLDHGVYLPPSQFESWFVGLAHDEDAIKTTIKAAKESFKILS
jgi:glutamate-1-semialdehyde 2,1-aminomutase